AAIFRSTEGPFLCVGSIISKNIVLTSTICLGNSPGDLYPDQYSVLAGVVDLMEEVSSQWRYVVQVIKSPATLNDNESDVVILVLNAPFRINWKVKPIPMSLEPFRGRRICQVIGWGPSNYDDGYEDPQEEVQKVVSVVAVDKHTCQHVFPKAGPELNKCLCVEPVDEANTACIADDGSPVICDEELVGLVRHEGGNVCANDTYPGMYTDIGMLGSWTSLHVPPNEISTSEFGKHSTAADPTYHLVLHAVLSFIFQTIAVVFIIK
ncbi:unnamed protein product, partial [Timema podura]|nr:unnamed protein product [Timema podura]